MDGFLGINKPSGCTSHDVVNQIRRLFHIKKVGHTGTLDPMATGVLVLCLGKYTRLSQYVTASDKKYRAEITLGVETDTQDREGQIIQQSDDVPEGVDALRDIFPSFLGKIEQIPPMHSAVRVGGKRLYELARKGEDVIRPSREVEIFTLDMVHYQKPILTLDVWCSKGTYIRTLAADLGHRLGCGAHLSQLQRTAVGQIKLSDCHTLHDIANVVDAGVEGAFLDIHRVLNLPRLTLSVAQTPKFVNGNPLIDIDADRENFEQAFCVFDCDDHLIGIGRWHTDGFRPECVIAQRES